MNTIITLLKREYWENRSSFVITPLAIGGFYLALILITLFNTEHLFEVHTSGLENLTIFGVNVADLNFLTELATKTFSHLDIALRTEIWEKGFYGYSTSFTLVLVIISIVYLLGSLYDDRKDKSILFWKSLPVSDLTTVMSKLATVIFVIPAIYVAATTISFIIIMIIASVITLIAGGSVWESIWHPAPIFSAPIQLYITYVIQSLWAAPFIGWLLLVSSWTKRKPIIVAFVPIGVITFMEAYNNRTSVFIDAVRERAVGWVAPIDFDTGRHLGDGNLISAQEVIYGKAHTLVSLPDFWYGLAIAGIMVAGAIYIRRYRDES